jgi:type II restriction/modification system DNA methylase subunit YeeA
MSPYEFIKKWKRAVLNERQAAQAHFLDLCRVLGHPDPISDDPLGERFCFEKGVTKTGGGEGFADVWKRGFFAWEYKKKKRDLNAALDQLVRYAAALENPPLQVACDTDRFLIRTAWTNAVPKTYELSLDDLAEPRNLDTLRWVFFDPEKLRPKETRAAVTREAADKFSTIALRLQGRDTPENVAHFVNQLVFCFFAHSVKLLPNGFFPKLLKRCAEKPENSKRYFDGLFSAMEDGGEFDLTEIAHFNGGLFDGRRALRLESSDIGLLQAAGSLDWSQIDPTIFGTLFERFLDPDKRGQIGAHYTDPEKIMMIVEPVILRPLREEWAAAKGEIEKLLHGEAKPPMRAKTKRRMSPQEAAEEVRSGFLERLRKVTILDPACGSGNFLYLALQGVKDIENRANLESEALGLAPQAPTIGPEIVHGIEINPLAAELARTTIWIGDIQWRLRNGIHSKPQPILRKLDSIECRDALITRIPSAVPEPLSSPLPASGERELKYVEAEWPDAEFIVGNPPFLGDKKFTGKMDKGYVDALRKTFFGRIGGNADLVCYWFEKAKSQIEKGSSRRAGLVATNSIRRGANRKVLDNITRVITIFEARSDEKWILEGAAVRVSLICFGQTYDNKRWLDGVVVAHIHPDLTSGDIDITRAVQLNENRHGSFLGIQKSGPLDVPGILARDWLLSPVNPNGRPNADVLRPFLNGDDVTARSRDYWLIDFPLEQTEATAALFQQPFEFLRSAREPLNSTLGGRGG